MYADYFLNSNMTDECLCLTSAYTLLSDIAYESHLLTSAERQRGTYTFKRQRHILYLHALASPYNYNMYPHIYIKNYIDIKCSIINLLMKIYKLA